MHVVVNAATSADGKLSTRRREQIRISGPEDRDRVDSLRAESDAVMVGIGTVLADDPSLTVDDPDRIRARVSADRPRQPARIVADSSARTPPDATVLDDRARTFVLVAESARAERIEAVRDGADVITAGDDRVDLATAFARLEARGIERVLVEGGGELIFSCFDAGLVDACSVYQAPVVFGGRDAPTLVDGPGFHTAFPDLVLESVDRIDDGVLLRYRVEDDPDDGERD